MIERPAPPVSLPHPLVGRRVDLDGSTWTVRQTYLVNGVMVAALRNDAGENITRPVTEFGAAC